MRDRERTCDCEREIVTMSERLFVCERKSVSGRERVRETVLGFMSERVCVRV